MWAHSEVGRDANHLWNVSLERIKAKNMLLLYQLWAGNIALRGECYILRSQYVKLLENNIFFFSLLSLPWCLGSNSAQTGQSKKSFPSDVQGKVRSESRAGSAAAVPSLRQDYLWAAQDHSQHFSSHCSQPHSALPIHFVPLSWLLETALYQVKAQLKLEPESPV